MRAPFRVEALDGEGTHVSLVYFGRNAGWAKKLFPLGEAKIVSGKLEAYGDSLQIIHPDHVLSPPEPAACRARGGLSAVGRADQRGGWRQLAAQALARAPDLPEWIEPSLQAKQGWPGWREAITPSAC